jgi:hypothetical protein
MTSRSPTRYAQGIEHLAAPGTETSERMPLSTPRYYRIQIAGQLDEQWADWLGGLSLRHTGEPTFETVLYGPLRDQSALYGVLNKIRDLGVTLLALERIEPPAEDVPMGETSAEALLERKAERDEPTS